MSPLHFQFERYDSDQVIRNTTLAIRQGTFSGSLLDSDGLHYTIFNRPGIIASRLTDGTLVSRLRNPDTYILVRWNPATGEMAKISHTLGNIAKAMKDGELFVSNGYGYRLFRAEQEMRNFLKADPNLNDKMEMCWRMDTTRRLPFMGIMILAAQKEIVIPVEKAQEMSILSREQLIAIGHAIDEGSWGLTPTPLGYS